MARRRRQVVAAALALSVLAAPAPAHAQQAAPRDAVITPTSGTASISGIVVNDEERPQPVRRAIVTLVGDELRPSRGAVTDDDGRFAIGNLPAGRFTLTVSRASYVTSVYGAKRPGRPGTPIVVADGAKLESLTVRLWRGAVVSGVVRDVSGAALSGIPVRAIPAKAPGAGSLTSLSNNGARTNEAGEFRIFGLEPGTYVVSADPASGASRMIALREAEVDAIFEALKRRSTTPASPEPAMPATPPIDFAPIFYPGVIAVAQATPLALSAGKEISGLDITLQRVQRSVVSGRVMRSDGTPAAGAAIQLSGEQPPGPFAPGVAQYLNSSAGPDGTFRIAQVAPGNYTLMARAPAAPPPPSQPGLVTPGPIGPQLWASTSLSVANADVVGLTLTVEPGFTVTGRVVFQSDANKPPANPALRVGMWPPEVFALKPGSPIESIAAVGMANVNPDGTFAIQNLAPGTYRLAVAGATITSDQWFLRSAVMGGADVLDGDFQIGVGGGDSMTLTLTDRTSELTGALQSASGAPNSDVFVIAYSANRAFWRPGTRRVQAVRPDVDGRYSLKNLPAGEYLLAAVLDIDQDDWNDPAFLDQLVPASIKITIGEGEKKTQDLRIGR
jgi:hypothetical protein